MKKLFRLTFLCLNIATFVVQMTMAVDMCFYENEIRSPFQPRGLFYSLFERDLDTIFRSCVFVGFFVLGIVLFARNIITIKQDKLLFSDLYYYAGSYFVFNMLILIIRIFGPETDGEGLSNFAALSISPPVFFITLVMTLIIFFVAILERHKILYIILSAICLKVALGVCGEDIASQYIYTRAACLLIFYEQTIMVIISSIEKNIDNEKTSIETENNNSTIK